MKIYQYVNFSDAEFVNFAKIPIISDMWDKTKDFYNNKVVPFGKEAVARTQNVERGVDDSIHHMFRRAGKPFRAIEGGFNDFKTGLQYRKNLASGLKKKAQDIMDKAPTDDANAYNNAEAQAAGLRSDAQNAKTASDRLFVRGFKGLTTGAKEIIDRGVQDVKNIGRSLSNFGRDSNNPASIDTSSTVPRDSTTGITYPDTAYEGGPIK